MSQDQKPARVRAVATTTAPSDPPGEAASQTQGATASPAPAKGGSLGGKIIFLVGCAAGGAGLAALPHFLPIKL